MKTMRTWALVGTLALGLMLSACSTSTGSDSGYAEQSALSMATEDSAGGVEIAEAQAGGSFDSALEGTVPHPSIIVSGDVTIATGDPAAAAEDFADYVLGMEGRIDSRSTSSFEDSPSASISARVPADRFEEVRAHLDQFGTVTNSNIYSDDVTQQTQDLDARIAALEESITRLQELMEQATTVEELISAEEGLTQRQGELDSLRSQLDWLDDQVQMSSLWVSFVTPSSAPGFSIAKAWQMFLTSIEVVGYALLVAAPWLVLAGLISWAIVAGRRGAQRKRVASSSDPAVVPSEMEGGGSSED